MDETLFTISWTAEGKRHHETGLTLEAATARMNTLVLRHEGERIEIMPDADHAAKLKEMASK